MHTVPAGGDLFSCAEPEPVSCEEETPQIDSHQVVEPEHQDDQWSDVSDEAGKSGENVQSEAQHQVMDAEVSHDGHLELDLESESHLISQFEAQDAEVE